MAQGEIDIKDMYKAVVHNYRREQEINKNLTKAIEIYKEALEFAQRTCKDEQPYLKITQALNRVRNKNLLQGETT